MAASVSLILVTHFSTPLVDDAVASFRAEATAGGWDAEVVIVDHSEDAAETARLSACAPERLLQLENRGYAAGINAGLASARGEALLLGNPDIVFARGALAALVEALDSGWDIVGPQFELAGFRLPPAEEQTPEAAWRRNRAGRSSVAWRHYMREELRRCNAVWAARTPCAAPALSGALLAVRRSTAAALGPWDDGYFLYFEETDWLRRARQRQLRLAVVPHARVLHRWGHAADPDDLAPVFEASRERYFRRHFGVAPPTHASSRVPSAAMLPPASSLGGEACWWLVSPSTAGFPFAGARASGRRLHDRLEALARDCPRLSTLTVTGMTDDDRFLGPWQWHSSAAAIAARLPGS